MPVQPVFYYDLGDPYCYLVAERVSATLPVVPEWEPVFGGQIGHQLERVDRDEVARLAVGYELQELRWPRAWPPDTRQAMLAATYAKRVGRAVAFSLAAFRQAFAAGRDLGDGQSVLIAGAACEMHPAALLKGISLRSVRQALEDAGERARSAGVRRLPAIELDGELVEGESSPEAAAALLGGAR